MFKIIDRNNWKRNPYFDHYFDKIPCTLEKPRDFDPFGQTGFAHLWLQYD